MFEASIHSLSLKGDTKQFEQLLTTENANQKDQFGETLLFNAAHNGALSTVELLLSDPYNVDPNLENERSWTPLLSAALKGHTDIAQHLSEKGANPNQKNIEGYTPLHKAALNGHLEIVKLLIEKHSVDFNQEDNHGWTPLNWAAQHGHIEVVQYLLEHGAIVDKANNFGWTPLFCAARKGHTNIVKLLLSDPYNADPNLADQHGWTPFIFAAENKHDDVFQCLLNHNADPHMEHKNGETSLLKMAKYKMWNALTLMTADAHKRQPNKTRSHIENTIKQISMPESVSALLSWIVQMPSKVFNVDTLTLAMEQLKQFLLGLPKKGMFYNVFKGIRTTIQEKLNRRKEEEQEQKDFFRQVEQEMQAEQNAEQKNETKDQKPINLSKLTRFNAYLLCKYNQSLRKAEDANNEDYLLVEGGEASLKAEALAQKPTQKPEEDYVLVEEEEEDFVEVKPPIHNQCDRLLQFDLERRTLRTAQA
jgi:ankyrin repeat protein